MRCLNYVFENRREKGKKKRIFRFDPLRIIHVIVYTFYRQYSKVIFDLLWIRQTKQIAWLLVKADSQECVNAFICIFHPIYIYIFPIISMIDLKKILNSISLIKYPNSFSESNFY